MKRFTVTLTLMATLVLLAGSTWAAVPAQGKVNINKATVAQLQLLPRIGPAIAKRIVDFRSKNGSFQKVEEIMLVRGVGERTFASLKPYLAISGETTLEKPVPAPRAKKGSK